MHPDLRRFLDNVEDGPGGCWLWTAYTNEKTGYSTFMVGRRPFRAHRWAWEHWLGPIPEGLELDHLCRVRHCVNPAHLEPVTARENTLRGRTITAAAAAATHCPQFHPYRGGNLYLRPDGKGRGCRRCRSSATRRYKETRRVR